MEEESVPFGGAQIQKSEAKILQEIEKELEIQFIKVDNFNFNTSIGFMVENDRIKGLSLYKCDITKLPESLFKLIFLEVLNLSFNQLTTLPDSIIRLTSLQKLDLSYNMFKSIPKSLFFLTSLEELSLNVNQIESISKKIMNLISLQKLDLRFNVLFSLPDSMKNLRKLKSLMIKDNPLVKNIEKETKILIKHLQQKGVSITK